MKIGELEQIIKILKQNDVTDFELEHDGTHIKLSRAALAAAGGVQGVRVAVPDVQPAIVGAVNGKHPEPSVAVVAAADNLTRVESPLVGTFYRKPSPDAQPFVSEGAAVKKGDTLCIVEAMKLMNEIEAPVSGRVEKVCAKDASVVEFGEILFLINPSV